MSEQERLAAESALEALKNSTEEMVTAAQIAPILHMNPGVIVKYAKDGTWIQDNMGKFIISGDRVKFFRRDFLQKCGFIPKDAPKRTVEDLLDEISTKMDLLLGAITTLMNQSQRREFVETWADPEDKKTASAGTLTD